MYFPQALFSQVDRRMNAHELDSLPESERTAAYPDLDKIKTNFLAVACLMKGSELEETDKGEYKLSNNVVSLSTMVSNSYKSNWGFSRFNADLALGEKFRDEPAPGFGTAFLVAANIVFTAGHCVAEISSSKLQAQTELEKIRVVFRYHKTDAGVDKSNFNKDDVYRVKKVLWYEYTDAFPYVSKSEFPDYAVLQLDRPVVGIPPISLESSSEVQLDREIYALGCPTGTAVKFSPGCVKGIDSNRVYGDTDSLRGNSGGPIINRVTHKAMAILVTGPGSDFEIDEEHQKRTGEVRVISTRVTQGMKKQGKYVGYQRITPEMIKFYKNIAYEIPEMLGINPSNGNLAELSAVKINALGVACIIPKDHLVQMSDSFQLTDEKLSAIKESHLYPFLKRRSWATPDMVTEAMQRFNHETFSRDPPLGYCTAFLVRPDTVIMCPSTIGIESEFTINQKSMSRFYVVFGFQKETEIMSTRIFKKEDVYTMSCIIKTDSPHFEVLRLDREVENRAPLKLEDSELDLNATTDVYTLGYPLGTSLKLARGMVVGEIGKNFRTNIRSYAGNNGSPIFSSRTHKVIGFITHVARPNPSYRNFEIDEKHKKQTGQLRLTDPKDHDRMKPRDVERHTLCRSIISTPWQGDFLCDLYERISDHLIDLFTNRNRRIY